jgi:TolB protein
VSGEAFNCDFVSPPTSTNVVRGTTTRVEIQTTCTPYLRNTIVYTSAEFAGAVMAVRPDGSRRARVSFGGLYATPAVSPDGQTIAVALAGDAIYLLLDRFGNQKLLIGGGNLDGSPAWSPDGTKLAFHRRKTTQYGDFGRIFVVNRDGTGLRQLSPDPAPGDFDQVPFDFSPSWSPDGSRVVFGRSGVISIINADGTGLVSTGVSGSTPDWSPDGAHIVYGSNNGGNAGIWVMDMSFTPHQLTTPVQADQSPQWSPDGAQIVFERAEGGVFQIYKMNADGSGVTKLSISASDESGPNWSPNF